MIFVEYLGDLRTRCVHEQSGTEILTDAPSDNNGKGEAFSPTDLVATAYVSCVITTIGIYCMQKNIAFKNATAKTIKIMTSQPRKIGKLIIDLDLSDNLWTAIEQQKIEQVAKTCPVAKSVNEAMIIEMNIKF